jgi:hypothetical protein
MSNLHIDGLVFPASFVVTKSLSSSMLCVYPWFKELRGIEVLLKVSEDTCGCYTLGLIDSCRFGLISVLYHSHRFNSKAQGKSHREQGRLPTEDALVNFLSRHCGTQSKALPDAHLTSKKTGCWTKDPSRKWSAIASPPRIPCESHATKFQSQFGNFIGLK